MRSCWRRVLERLTPPHLRAQVVAAESELDDARSHFAAVVDRDPAVNQLVEAHRLDRARNHYGERIANALGGGGRSWTSP